jgi:ribosomal-protein-alanine N-acetyltransferase
VGYGGIMTVLDESDVVNIAVLPNFRCKGYGRMLLQSLEDMARKNGASLLHLEVRQSNVPAIGLYEGFGFTTDGIRKNYYTKPLENAVLMTKKI